MVDALWRGLLGSRGNDMDGDYGRCSNPATLAAVGPACSIRWPRTSHLIHPLRIAFDFSPAPVCYVKLNSKVWS